MMRFDCESTFAGAYMQEDDKGLYVRYSDAKARIAELDKELDRMHTLFTETAKYRDGYMGALTSARAENHRLREQIEKWKLARWQAAGCPIGGGG